MIIQCSQADYRLVINRFTDLIRIPRVKLAMLFILVSIQLLFSPVGLASNCVSSSIGSDDFRQKLIDQAKFALVEITNKTKYEETFKGSGFFVEDEGLLLTNFHVVRNARALLIYHHNSGKQYTSDDLRIIAVDPIKDIALLKVNNIAFGSRSGFIKLKQCHEKVESDNPEIVIVAHSAGVRNFVTTGTVGNRDSISYVMPERVALVPPAERSRYQYHVLLFENVVAPGNSGAPVMNKSNGNIIGIVTGAVGRREYAAFAIPVEYAVEFLKKNELKQGHKVDKLADDTFAAIDSNDQYYRLLNTYHSDSIENLVSISGTVVDKFSQIPIEGVVITITNLTDNNQTFSQETDKTGHYGFAIPRSSTSNWKLTATHINYELADREDTDLGIINSDRLNLKNQFIIKKKYAMQASWFYVHPPFVKLESKPEKVDIKYEYTEWGKPRRKAVTSQWSLCRDEGSECDVNERFEWLQFLKTRGDITERGGKLVLLPGNIEGIDPLLQYEDLPIFAPKENRSTSLYVYGRQDENEIVQNHIQGFVTLDAGGTAIPGTFEITAKIIDSEKGVDAAEINWPLNIDDGYFQVEVPSSFATSSKKLKLDVTSNIYEDATRQARIIDLSKIQGEPLNLRLKLK